MASSHHEKTDNSRHEDLVQEILARRKNEKTNEIEWNVKWTNGDCSWETKGCFLQRKGGKEVRNDCWERYEQENPYDQLQKGLIGLDSKKAKIGNGELGGSLLIEVPIKDVPNSNAKGKFVLNILSDSDSDSERKFGAEFELKLRESKKPKREKSMNVGVGLNGQHDKKPERRSDEGMWMKKGDSERNRYRSWGSHRSSGP